jgi:hypothetical protein
MISKGICSAFGVNNKAIADFQLNKTVLFSFNVRKIFPKMTGLNFKPVVNVL